MHSVGKCFLWSAFLLKQYCKVGPRKEHQLERSELWQNSIWGLRWKAPLGLFHFVVIDNSLKTCVCRNWVTIVFCKSFHHNISLSPFCALSLFSNLLKLKSHINIHSIILPEFFHKQLLTEGNSIFSSYPIEEIKWPVTLYSCRISYRTGKRE